MPPHLHYCEPYFGGGSVLLAKDPEGVSEAVNDIDGRLMNFWKCLAVPRTFPEFVRAAQATPFSEAVWEGCVDLIDDCECHCKGAAECVYCALRFFVRCRQSLAGRGKAFAPLSTARTRRGMNEQASAWLSAVEGLPAVHARLARVAITCRPAIDCIRQQDGPGTLFYLDPPYMLETRKSKDVYGFEMQHECHEKLLTQLSELNGKFILSGYNSKLYDWHSGHNGWHRRTVNVPNNAAGGKTKRRMEECLWTNF